MMDYELILVVQNSRLPLQYHKLHYKTIIIKKIYYLLRCSNFKKPLLYVRSTVENSQLFNYIAEIYCILLGKRTTRQAVRCNRQRRGGGNGVSNQLSLASIYVCVYRIVFRSLVTFMNQLFLAWVPPSAPSAPCLLRSTRRRVFLRAVCKI